MDAATVMDVVRDALVLTLLVSAPMLGVALLVGLVIGLVQAATSINEMTLSFIPKLIAMAIAAVVFGGWMMQIMADYMRGIFLRIPGLFS